MDGLTYVKAKVEIDEMDGKFAPGDVFLVTDERAHSLRARKLVENPSAEEIAKLLAEDAEARRKVAEAAATESAGIPAARFGVPRQQADA